MALGTVVVAIIHSYLRVGASGMDLTNGLLPLGLNEYFSGFDNIGHNSWPDLVLMWIIPK